MRQLLYNAEIFNRGRRFHGFVEITGDRISKVSEGEPDPEAVSSLGCDAVDMGGHWLFPGAIDSHVHFRDPGLTHKADMASESRAAIAGGVTSFIDMPNTKPPTLSMADVEAKMSVAAKHSMANYAFYIGASGSNLEELKNADYTRIPGIKLFLGSSTGNMCVSDSDTLDEIFRLPHLISVHCEDESVIKDNTARLKALYGDDPVPVAWHPVVRSELACFKSTAAAVERAGRFGTRLHVCHVTTAEELRLTMDRPGVSVEACIPHLWFCDRDYDRLGSFIKCNPAVKSDRHREALRRALSTGAIDVVSTDHAPHTLGEKEGDAFTAPSGMPMVQFSLRVMLRLASEGILTPERVVELMCHNQAELFAIENRGYLEEGMYADIVEIDPDGNTMPVSAAEVVSKCGWSPMTGALLPAKVERVWVNGTLTFDRGRFTDEPHALPLKFQHFLHSRR